ncbi:hypothetical protein [Alistipes sp. ZOR0009]|uniref:hypothetical protein n=1 Tax=Alistipes sp. ZOR0009 TaxID=1339253 RepID=UPI000647D980|nr:hypothetical protein [Alistipes sp. ZOR0009]
MDGTAITFVCVACILQEANRKVLFYLDEIAMLKMIEKLAQGKILTEKEQKDILGAISGVKCLPEDGCSDPNYCCYRGVCVMKRPLPGGGEPGCMQ